jgi:hypothetical protein
MCVLHLAVIFEIAILNFLIAGVGWQSILGAFAKLRKATIRLRHVCPFV